MISASDTMRGQRKWSKHKMGPGIKGTSTQPCVEHRKLTWYCLASSCQVIVICRLYFFFSSSPSLKGILEMTSFLRDDKVNPIWSSSWRKWHLKLVLHLSNKPVSSLFTEYFWMETVWDTRVIKMNWNYFRQDTWFLARVTNGAELSNFLFL